MPVLALIAAALVIPAYSRSAVWSWVDDHRLWIIGAVAVLAALLAAQRG